MTKQDELVQADGVHKSAYVRHEGFGGVVAARGMVRVAATSLVYGIHVEISAQGLGNVLPDAGVPSQAVQQHQRRFALGAPVKVVDIDAVGGNVFAGGLYLRSHARHSLWLRDVVYWPLRIRRAPYFNCQLGRRFSANALGPSLLSSVVRM